MQISELNAGRSRPLFIISERAQSRLPKFCQRHTSVRLKRCGLKGVPVSGVGLERAPAASSEDCMRNCPSSRPTLFLMITYTIDRSCQNSPVPLSRQCRDSIVGTFLCMFNKKLRENDFWNTCILGPATRSRRVVVGWQWQNKIDTFQQHF